MFVSKSLRVARYLELIFFLINFYVLFFFLFVFIGNLLKINIFSEFNFVVFRYFLSWFLFVLFFVSFFLLKKWVRSFKVYRCRSVFGLERAFWIVFILVGVTYVLISFSSIFWEVCLSVDCCGVFLFFSRSVFRVL